MAITPAIAQAAFSSIRTAMPAGIIVLRIGGEKGWQIDEAFGPGFVKNHSNTDQGLIDLVQGSARYLSSEETATIDIGDVIEAKPTGQTEWITMRVTGRKVVAGLVQLYIGSEFA